MKFVGAHISAAGGLYNSFLNAKEINGRSFALFIKPRTWKYNPLTDKVIEDFKAHLEESDIKAEHILPHGQYIVNLGSTDEELLAKSYDYFLDDLQRCEQLGLKLYNLHPGSAGKNGTKDQSIKSIASYINKALHATKSVTVVLENMAGQGSHVGSDFEELKAVIDLIDDNFKKFDENGVPTKESRIGVCFDTCHAFAAGYDIRTDKTFDETLRKFDEQVGLGYLRAIHLNDSKGDLKCCKDRHENIGKGFIGLDAFKFVMNDSRFDDIPIILETPDKDNDMKVWSKEIKQLYDFVK